MSEQATVNCEQVPDEAEGFSEKEKAANRPGTEKRDWVGEAVQCFIKDVKDLDPTDPISAIAHYFAKNATDELKARCKAEGKNATYCWRFIEAVARKALGNRPGHIDPSAIYAIAMHYFEDVPLNWDGPTGKVSHTPKASAKVKKAKKETKVEKLERKVAQSRVSPARKAELRKELAEAKRKERAKKAAKKKSTPKVQQGFFFDMLEMQPDEQKPCGSSSPQGSPVAPAEETAVEPSSEAGVSSTESEV